MWQNRFVKHNMNVWYESMKEQELEHSMSEYHMRYIGQYEFLYSMRVTQFVHKIIVSN